MVCLGPDTIDNRRTALGPAARLDLEPPLLYRLDKERRFLLALLAGAILNPSRAAGQLAAHIRRVAVLSSGPPPPGLIHQLSDGLRELGYIEGNNVIIESRNADGRNERLGALADDFVRRKVAGRNAALGQGSAG